MFSRMDRAHGCRSNADRPLGRACRREYFFELIDDAIRARTVSRRNTQMADTDFGIEEEITNGHDIALDAIAELPLLRFQLSHARH